MKVRYTITVDLDVDAIALDAARRGRTPRQAAEEAIADLECRLVDACRWRDGVHDVRSQIAFEPRTTAERLIFSGELSLSASSK